MKMQIQSMAWEIQEGYSDERDLWLDVSRETDGQAIVKK